MKKMLVLILFVSGCASNDCAREILNLKHEIYELEQTNIRLTREVMGYREAEIARVAAYAEAHKSSSAPMPQVYSGHVHEPIQWPDTGSDRISEAIDRQTRQQVSDSIQQHFDSMRK